MGISYAAVEKQKVFVDKSPTNATTVVALLKPSQCGPSKHRPKDQRKKQERQEKIMGPVP